MLKGPLDLLHWYQDKLLHSADTGRATKRQEYVKKLVPKLDFIVLCDRVLVNVRAFHDPRPQITDAITEVRAEFEQDIQKNDLAVQEKYRRKLGFALLRVASKNELRILFDGF